MYFLNLKDSILGKIYVKKKDVYFKHSTSEQSTGEFWVDGKLIYTKTIKYDVNGAKNINEDIDLGISPSKVNELWIDQQNSFLYFNTDQACAPLNIVSKSGWYGIYAYLININSTSNIKLNLQSNSNTAINRVYITVRYTKK